MRIGIATLVMALLVIFVNIALVDRIVFLAWLAFVVLPVVRIGRRLRPPTEGGYVRDPQSHGDLITDFTLKAEVLDLGERVTYDERPHWGEAVSSAFGKSSIIATAVLLLCLLTPWVGLELPFLVPLKLIGIAGASYWLIRQEVNYLWTHYIVTDQAVYVLVRPPAIFGAEVTKSLELSTINTRDVHTPMIFRWMRMDMGHMTVDAPGQSDARFNNMRWVRRPKEVRRLLKPDSAEAA